MKEHRKEEIKLRQYLLGELNLEQQVLVEQRLFLDDDYSKLAQVVEDELIDEYTYSDLPTSERAKFETHFLRRPEHQQDLRIAQALKRFVLSQPIVVSRKSFFRSLFWRKPIIGISFATLLILLSVIGWLTFEYIRKQDRAPQLQGQGKQPTPANANDGQPAQTANGSGSNKGSVEANKRNVNERNRLQPGGRRSSSPDDSAARSVMAFTIPPGGFSRGEGQQQSRTVTIPSEVEAVILRLPLTTTQDYDRYLAILKSGGRTVHKFTDLKSAVDEEQGKVVPIKVPAKMLRSHNYEIELSGIASDERPIERTTYSFVVDRK